MEYLPCQLKRGCGAAAPCALGGLAAASTEPSPVLGKAVLPVPSEEIGTPEQTVGHPGLGGRVTALLHATDLVF